MMMIVEAYEKGLRFRNGRFVEVLDPGRYRMRRLTHSDMTICPRCQITK